MERTRAFAAQVKIAVQANLPSAGYAGATTCTRPTAEAQALILDNVRKGLEPLLKK